jgi:pyrimidine-nucleoside phosphorylase
VLDVKVGNGAFMETLVDARQLAKLMVTIGSRVGRRVVALLSDMNQPLGCAVGNALETKEAIDTLHGGGPADFREHCLIVASHMLVLGSKASSLEAAHQMAQTALDGGSAWSKFRTLVATQGGDVHYIDNPDLLPRAPLIETVTAPRSGYLSGINARQVGETAVELGAGRARKSDVIDPAVGIIIHQKVGNKIHQGDPLFTIHASSPQKLEEAGTRLLAAHSWSEIACQPLPLIYEVIR